MIVLVDVDPAALRLLDGHERAVEFSAVPDDLLARLSADGADVEAIVLGPGLREPVELAQRVHALDRQLPIVILSEPDRHEQVARAVELAPLLGEDVSCLPLGEPERLAGDLDDAVRRGGQRRLQSSVEKASARLEAEGELRRRFEQLQAIYGVAALVARSEALEEVLDEVLERLLVGVGAERGAILLFDEQHRVRLVAWRALSDDHRAAAEHFSPWDTAAEAPQPLVVGDVAAGPALDGFRDAVLRDGVRSLAAVPALERGRLIGEFLLYRDEPVPFSGEDLHLAQAIASHVATAAVRRRAERALQESRDQLAVIFQGVGDGITVQDASGRLVFANEAAARLAGFDTAEELIAAPPGSIIDRFELVDEAGRPLRPDELPGRRALGGEESEAIVGHRMRSSGEERWSFVKATPISNERGEVELAINIFHDVTERRRAEQGVQFLAQASQVLTETLDYGRTLVRLAKLAVPRLADWCMVYMLEPDGSIERLAVEHAGGLQSDVLEHLRAYRFDPAAETGVPAVLRSGEPLLVPDADARIVAQDMVGGESLVEELGSLGITSWMCVPLSARGRTLGAISLLSAESGRRFGERDLELAGELARRAALAVDNARLFREAAETAANLDTLVATAPVGVGFWDREFRCVRINQALAELYGLPPEAHLGRTAAEVLPGRWATLEPIWQRVLESGSALLDIEVSSEAGEPEAARHWLASHYPVRTSEGETLGIGTVVVETTERKRAEAERARLLQAERTANERLEFLAEASVMLASSLDYEATLASVAKLVVPRLADWCTVDVLGEDGAIRRLALAHADPERMVWAAEMARRYAPDPEADFGSPWVIRTGEPQLVPAISDDQLVGAFGDREEPLWVLRELGLRSSISVPLPARGRTLGAITLITAESGRVYGADDLKLARELARRAGVAVDNARLFHEAEQRAQAAQALMFVGDGVFLVDREGVVRLWNRAAEAITGLRADDVVGSSAADAVPGWSAVAARIRVVASEEDATGRPQTVPIEVNGSELWLSISAVGFAEGTVFAFRDITEERAVDRMKSDFVSTVSHELRTPLAAIYGAALTLRRADVKLEEEQRDALLGVISSEAERLARIVNDILWASRVESGNLQVTIESCDAVELTAAVVQSTRLRLPPRITLDLLAPDDLPPVVADPDKVRQLLANLIENAIKYSPDGGRIQVRLEQDGGLVRFAVSDSGLGIPPAELERIFEKFYRLDPNLTRGVGGTGLGLYICRELVRRMDGRISVESRVGEGSTFTIELPTVDEPGEHGGP